MRNWSSISFRNCAASARAAASPGARWTCAGAFPDERSGKETLRKLLSGRKVLLVLDDFWQRDHAEVFNVIGAMGHILLTTRDAGLVTALASKETHYHVELPTEAEAETIFAAATQLAAKCLIAQGT